MTEINQSGTQRERVDAWFCSSKKNLSGQSADDDEDDDDDNHIDDNIKVIKTILKAMSHNMC